MASKIAVITLIIILGLINTSIAGKEKLLASGKIVYLQLAPVDPRSLMQGDYMALRFALADDVKNALPIDNKTDHTDIAAPSDGDVIVRLDAQGIGKFEALYNAQPLAADQILMHYRVRNNTVKFASNAFFFQEGHSQDYTGARYGQFRVNDSGDILLASLYDENLNILGLGKAPDSNLSE